MLQKKVVEQIATRTVRLVTVTAKIVEKYCRAGQATNDSMAHAHCMVDN